MNITIKQLNNAMSMFPEHNSLLAHMSNKWEPAWSYANLTRTEQIYTFRHFCHNNTNDLYIGMLFAIHDPNYYLNGKSTLKILIGKIMKHKNCSPLWLLTWKVKYFPNKNIHISHTLTELGFKLLALTSAVWCTYIHHVLWLWSKVL